MFSVSRSLAVFTLPSPPIVSGASQICFISMQPARRTFLAPIIEVCLVLGVAVVLGAPFFFFQEVLFSKKHKRALIPFVPHVPTQLCSLYFSLRFLLPTVAHWPEGWNPWIVIIPSRRRSNGGWKAVDLCAPGPGIALFSIVHLVLT